MGIFEKTIRLMFSRNFIIYQYAVDAMEDFDLYLQKLEERIERLEHLQNVSKGE